MRPSPFSFDWRLSPNRQVQMIGPGAPFNMRLFTRRQEKDAVLMDRYQGKTYDLPTRQKKKKNITVVSSTNAVEKQQKQKKNRYDSPFRPSPHEHATIPMIDRIPTAVGYHSDGSEEEWLEEKSRCSRYDAPDDDEDELREDISLSDGEEGDDKYSVGRKADGIERLWSEGSSDSVNRQPQQTWDQYDEKQKIESYYKPDDVSYLVESKNDPIYESPRNSPVKETIVVAPDLIDQSVVTAKPKTKQDEAQGETKQDEAQGGTIIESKSLAESESLKLETEATPEAETVSEPNAISEPVPVLESPTDRHNEELVPVASELQLDSEASKELDAIMSYGQLSDDPIETLAATDLLVKEIEAKLKALKVAAAKEKKTLKKLQRENKRSQTRGRNMERSRNPTKSLVHRSLSKTPKARSSKEVGVGAPEITKSLLNGFNVMLFRKSGEKQKSKNRVEDTAASIGNDKDELPLEGNPALQETESEPVMLEGKLVRQKIEHQETTVHPEMETTNLPSDTAYGEISQSKTSFWDRPLRSVFGVKSETAKADLVRPVSPTLSDPPENDEYSMEGPPAQTPKTPQGPALVQCWKFYSCGSIAEDIGETMKAADRYRNAGIALCGSPTVSMEHETAAVTPKPTVEVVLEEIDRPKEVAGDQKSFENKPKRKFFSQKSTASITDASPEAPVLLNSRGHSKIINVTGLKLHLDGDSESGRTENKKAATEEEMKDFPADNISNASSARVSVTSIKVPTITTKKRTSKDIPRNRSRLPKFFKKLSSKKHT